MPLAEQSLAGAILIDGRCLSAVRPVVKAGDFASQPCAAVFRAACCLADEGQVIDPVSIQSRAARSGDQLTTEFLIQLMEITPSAANAEQYAQTVRDGAVRRRVVEAAQNIQDTAHDPTIPTAEVLASAVSCFQGLDTGAPDALLSSADAAAAFLDYREGVESGYGGAVVSTGIPKLDSLLGAGMVREGLYILAARPGVGKTTVGLKIADLVSREKGVLFVSLEMSKEQLTARRVADRSGLPIGKVLLGRAITDEDREKICAALSSIAETRLVLNRKAGASVADIGLMARSVSDLGLVVVDYLGLIDGETRSDNLYQKTTANSNALKRLARSLGVPILCLAQLNRASEQRTDKRPTMADLRDSGAIEQDADGVLLLHRPAVYALPDKRPKLWEGELLELIVAKNRHGATGNINLTFYGTNGRIRE